MAEYKDGEIILNWERANAEIAKEVDKITTEATPKARANAPKRTGALKKSIRKRKTFQGRFTGLVTGEVQATQLPGLFIEKGTRKMRAKPFLEPSIDADKAAERIAEAIVRGI